MQGWTDDLRIALPPNRTVAELVDFVLQSAIQAVPAKRIVKRLSKEFGLSKDDAALACDRSFGGLVRAATRNPLNCPPQDKDPVAWESFQRGSSDPSLVARIYPDLAPKRSHRTRPPPHWVASIAAGRTVRERARRRSPSPLALLSGSVANRNRLRYCRGRLRLAVALGAVTVAWPPGRTADQGGQGRREEQGHHKRHDDDAE